MLASSKMNQVSIWVVFILSFLLLQTTKSVDEEVKSSLINFYKKLSTSNSAPGCGLGWNLTSDPCKDQWMGVICDSRALSVKKIVLDSLNFAGTFDASVICNVQSLAASLAAISLKNNSLGGENLDDIANCKQLTHLYIGGNRFSGRLPDSLSRLNNLRGLDISGNNFSGSLPDLTLISGFQVFFAQNNQLTGPIPKFDFPNLAGFTVSFNNFTGRIPVGAARFPASSFIGNPELCGEPLPKQCP